MLRNLDDFKYYVNCYFDFVNTLSELEKYNIKLEANEEVECFIGSYSDMLSELLGLEERTDDFKAFQNLIYGRYDDNCQLDEAIEYFWNTLQKQKPKTYFSVDEDEPLPTGHTGSISGNNDFDWEEFFNDLLNEKEFKVKIFRD